MALRCTPLLTLRCMNLDDFSYISRNTGTITSASNDMRERHKFSSFVNN